MMAYPHAFIGNFDVIRSGRAMSCNLFMNDSASPFCVWTYGTKYSILIPTASQNASNALDRNSVALSIRKVRMGLSGKDDQSCIIYARIRGKAIFLVAKSETCDHRPEASMRTRKYLNGPQGGFMGPQMSP